MTNAGENAEQANASRSQQCQHRGMMGEILRDTRCFGAAGRLMPCRVFDDDQRLRLSGFIARECARRAASRACLSRPKRGRTNGRVIQTGRPRTFHSQPP